jgi:C1A family cysteine protease
MFRKSVLLSFCLVFIFSMVLLHGDENELQRLRAQGQEEGWTFTVGQTSVSDKPLSAITGLKIPKQWWKNAPFDGRGDQEGLEAVPSTFDWRNYGKVTSVKNQGSCGSCWAFGMLGSYEGALLVADQGSQNLSEQYLVRCNTYGYGCGGGWWCFDDMYNGIPKESCYPYTGSDGSCNHSCTKYFPVDSWYHVGSSGGVPSTSALKQAIYDQGPICVAVRVTSAFQNYSGGIFNSCSSGSVNHAVVLVGWGSNYWIMKNSWGTGWGESGYMRITFGCSSIGYAACYAIPEDGPGPSGDYYRFMNRYSGLAMDVNGTNAYVRQYTYNGNTDKHWEIIDLGNGYKRIDNRYSGYSLDVGSGNYVYQYTWNGNTDKHWQMIDLGNGYYRFDNRYSGYSLDVGSGSYVYHYTWNGNTDKQWQLIEVD